MKRSDFLSLFSMVFPGSLGVAPSFAQDGPDLIFRKSTDFKLLTPNDKLATYAVDDPLIDGVVCYYTAHEKGGVAGMFGVAEQTSEVSLACRQYGPIKIKEKFGQGDVVFSERRSLLFKRMQIVRGCDTKRNVLVYMVYSDRLVEGSPQSSTATVPIQPWGGTERDPLFRIRKIRRAIRAQVTIAASSFAGWRGRAFEIDRGGDVLGAAEGVAGPWPCASHQESATILPQSDFLREAFEQAVTVLIGNDIGRVRAVIGLRAGVVSGAINRPARSGARMRGRSTLRIST